MASRSTISVPVTGRVDQDGRLIAADGPLERLQVEAGSALGRPLALPQIAALVRAAASLGVPLSRAVTAADSDHDLDLFVRAEPIIDGDTEHVLLTIEHWVARPMAPPRLALVHTSDDELWREAETTTLEFAVDASLHLIELSPALATRLAIDPAAALSRPLTALFRLVEEADGTMPLLGAVATRGKVIGQRAVPRAGGDEVIIDADPQFDDQGAFAGFTARLRHEESDAAGASPPFAFEESLDEALRTPLARIISAADHILERGDGPLRSDYASYASDIAAAGRHLLSVIRSMGKDAAAATRTIDLHLLAVEAAALVQTAASARGIKIDVASAEDPCSACGEAAAVVQVLVNILGDAIRHSPQGGTVRVAFEQSAHHREVSVADHGPGIAPVDQHRIFERYERVGSTPDGSGLGLAISRRLARSMGGDIRLDSATGQGARFTLVLPAG